MAIRKNITVKCDICGKERTFNEFEHEYKVWRHSVWVSVKTPSRDYPVLTLEEIDACDDCMRMQTVLEGDADGTIEIKNVRNIRFAPIVERERRLMDAIDAMPEDGGEL